MLSVKENHESTEGVWTQLLAANWWRLFAWLKAAKETSASQNVAQKVGTITAL